MKKQKKVNKHQTQKVVGKKPKRLVNSHFRIAGNVATGKLIHYRQTSHLILVILLIIVGVFIYFAKHIVDTQTVLGANTVSITAIVPEKTPAANQTNTTQPTSTSSSTSLPSEEAPIEVNAVDPVTTTTLFPDYSFWLDASIPLYYIILALTLGFWAGDLFDRKFGPSKYKQNTRKAT